MLAERLAGESKRHPRAVGLEDRFASLLPEVLIGIGLDQFAALPPRRSSPGRSPRSACSTSTSTRVSVREQAALVVERLRAAAR